MAELIKLLSDSPTFLVIFEPSFDLSQFSTGNRLNTQCDSKPQFPQLFYPVSKNILGGHDFSPKFRHFTQLVIGDLQSYSFPNDQDGPHHNQVEMER